MRRHGHHRSRAVFRQHEIPHPDGHLRVRKWIRGEAAGEEALFLGRGQIGAANDARTQARRFFFKLRAIRLPGKQPRQHLMRG